ncbi:hypothetical protein NDU88_002118 [Pleurodeles waltl]|uniref:Uncharacterized protein n=1 Tax=Pleurodeles waltl TaxID=8319 RepID=A0AAV7M788_PLEWA|nr:hypothetical protein NDU88_002118 [Pleurodeles waltl]
MSGGGYVSPHRQYNTLIVLSPRVPTVLDCHQLRVQQSECAGLQRGPGADTTPQPAQAQTSSRRWCRS